MKLSTECLEASQVDSLLQGNLTPEEYESAQDHLELCETCRARVEATIGPEQWWSDVQSVLLNSRTGAFSQRNASSTDAEPYERSTAKLLDLLGPTDDPNMLGRIGPYEIIGLLGQGGMGAVFKGFDRSLNRFVAIKMLLPHLAASGAARKRFAREGQAVAAVVDDHVMAIHCVDEWRGVPYLVMTYSRGVSLQKRLSDNGPLEVREILRIGMQAAKGLAAAHAQGIVHRDIKPANIFLDQNVERVQLMDFGLARAVDDASLTRSGTLAGTPQYMSPEQARAETVDHRSDLFSLGSVMYAMCTGHAPFRAESSYSVLRLITDKEPRPIREVNPDVPDWLCAMISKLMAKQAEDRFVSADEVATLLECCLAHVQQPTTNPLPVQDLQPRSNIGSQQTSAARLSKWLQLGIERICQPPIVRSIAITLFVFSLIFAGVMIVLETNKGTLTIESDADAVPIRIKQGDEFVKSLVVDREGAKTRLHAGQYTLEIDAPGADYDVSDSQVIVSRGTNNLVKITYRSADQASATPLGPQQGLLMATVEFNNLHPSDAKGKPRPPFDTEEFLAFMKWKLGNDELSDEMVKAIHPILNTRDRPLPTGWRFVGGQIDETCPHGVVHSWQIKLETNGLSKPLVIRRSAMALSTDQKTVETAKALEAMGSLESLVEQFNAKHRELERRARLPHEINPLTTDEVLAALAWSGTEDTSSRNNGVIAEWRPEILATHHLPQGSRLELIPSIENAIGQRFYIERIELLIPKVDDSAEVDALTIRKQFIGQDLDPSATRWSKPGENGLQVGMRVLPASNTYQHGQVVDIEFLYRSTTSRKVPATLPDTFQFEKVEGIRLERISFVEPKWPDGTTQTLIGNEPLAVRGHRMQICFNSDEELKPGVNLRAITRPDAHHYVRFTIQNPGDDSQGEMLELFERLDFRILPVTPPKILPLYESHYYQHWGTSIPNYRLPEESNPDPEFVDTFQIGVSLGPAEQHRIPAYYPSGLQVTKVAPHSPAAAVGIEVGDIILTWEENQLYGDDPTKPFAHYSIPNSQLKNELEKYRKSKGWSSFSIDLDLLDHRTGEVIRIYPTFGRAANGGPNKAEILKRMAERKLLRRGSE